MIPFYSSNTVRIAVRFFCFLFLFNSITTITLGQIAAWDASSASAFGVSPFAPTTLNAHLSSSGLVRGAGVGSGGSGAAGGWGGNSWATTANDAISGNKTVEFTLTPATGYKMSLSFLNLHYRRSNTGPITALLQYAVDNGNYSNITILSFSSNSTSGADIPAVNLQGITALQGVEGKQVSFRLVPYGGSNASGTWYVYKSNLSIDGNVEETTNAGPTNCQSITFTNGVNLNITGMGSNDATGVDDASEINAFAWTCNANGQPICNVRTLFKLDVSDIPVGTVIASAKLKLFAKTDYPWAMSGQPTYGSANAGLLQRATANWLPGVGWPNIPTVDATTEKTLPNSTGTAQNYEVDITDFVQSWINRPDSNFGMLFRMKVEQYYNSLVFHAGKAPSPNYLRPQLNICFNTNVPVPIHLLQFIGNLSGTTANLSWDTDNELDMDHFELQKSINGTDFTTITTVNAHNRSGVNNYSYADINQSVAKAYYRLKMFDKNGQITYSRIVAFTLPLAGTHFSFVVSPNPAHGIVQLQIATQENQQIAIKITDAIGRELLLKYINITRGINNIPVTEAGNFVKGVYFISLQAKDGVKSQRLLID